MREKSWRLLAAGALALAALHASRGGAEDGGAPLPSRVPMPPARAEGAPTPGRTVSGIDVGELTQAAERDEAFLVRYGNRPIIVLRGRLLGRSPIERARVLRQRFDDLVDQGVTGPVTSEVIGTVAVIRIAGRDALTILPTDVDVLSGATLETLAHQVAGNLARAMTEVAEARSPAMLLHGALWALAATALAGLAVVALWWLRERASRRVSAWIEAVIERALARRTEGGFWRSVKVQIFRLMGRGGRALMVVLVLALVYGWLSFCLRQFPYTRPWGEALRGFVTSTLLTLGGGILASIPGLFTVAIIVAITRLAAQLVGSVFGAVESERLALPWVYPETAQTTRRLAVGLLWVFAVVVAYPYLPGSGTDAFKGVSVLVGLMVSLGSTGFVNQAMSSFMITYSRAIRLGDYVRIGDAEGTVVHAGLLATKIRTRRNEEVTLPNAVVAATKITNYSRHHAQGVLISTSVTIGYDVPWRQVEAMLLLAASRTTCALRQPAPCVMQTGLQDFYVEYALLVVPDRPENRSSVLAELHGHIQDVFNENGVQIMSPHYRGDPPEAKVVPPARWYAPPARPDSQP